MSSNAGRNRANPVGCGFLSERELDAWLDGRMATPQRMAFLEHQHTGCADCALLAADMASFSTVVRHGPLVGERRQFDATRAIVAARLRQEPVMEKPAGFSFAAPWSWLSWRLVGGLAAAALIVVVFAPDLFRQGSPGQFTLPDGSDVVFTPGSIQPPPVTRGSGAGGVVDLWSRADEAWRNGEWREAADALGRIRELAPGPDVALYHGRALVMAGEFEEGDSAFVSAESQSDAIGADTTTILHSRGMAALGRHHLDDARRYLQIVASRDHPLAADARELLERLD
ncbi:MAG: hypothetical protein OES25_10855 [Acidobacteriota bacterium]|nr:hypothetical protein [Acidobacteriota bacterium]